MSRVTNPIGEPSVTSGFFNSNNDRKYDAESISKIFDGVFGDGVFKSYGGKLKVSARSGVVVNVATGKCWFDHTWTTNEAVLPVNCGGSEALLDRIDAIVVEINKSAAVRDNSIKAVKGVPSSTPERPTMIHTDDVNQYPLAYISRPAGSSEITDSDITNMVGTTETPYIYQLLPGAPGSYMSTAGGAFTGSVTAYAEPRTDNDMKNIAVFESDGETPASTVSIKMVRK